jgi:hypothetical protein
MSSEKKLLITRPRHDPLLEYLFYWSQELINSAEDHKIRVLDCKDKEANKETVCKYLEKQKPGLVIFNGHGNQNIIAGYQDQELIKTGENEHLLKSKIIYAIACKTAAKLGEEACKKGAKTFIGYAQDFGVVMDSSRICSPTKDRFSEPFKKASNKIGLSLIKGNTTNEAYEKSQNVYTELIREYATSNATKEDKEIRFWLFWNKRFQKIIGDKNATI